MINTSKIASPPHLQIFNPSKATQTVDRKFTIFSQLPKELRLQIWRHAMHRQRIIKVRLELPSPWEMPENPDPDINRPRYTAIVEGYQVLSKLLRVSSESRDECLKFYRVHIPCQFAFGEPPLSGQMETTPGTFYFNPEYDFLHLIRDGQIDDPLIDFLYHLKTIYDPRGIGLLNLAIDRNGIDGCYTALAQPSTVDPTVKQAFVDTLTHIHEVFFVHTPRAGRVIVGLWYGIWPLNLKLFNRSFPIVARAPTFERLQRDPRPIAEDLKQVFEESDQRDVFLSWRRLLQHWRIAPVRVEYRVLLTMDPAGDPDDEIMDRESAEGYLRREDEKWKRVSPEKAQAEDLEKVVRPAFGFWLFPLETFGPMREEGTVEEEGYKHRAKTMLDLTGYWPELAVADLTM
ncbi:uncharacterized protein BDZ99DRAFT_469003, partial [Mytilinidion resinicola]